MNETEIKAMQELNATLQSQVTDLTGKSGDAEGLRTQLVAKTDELKDLVIVRDNLKTKVRTLEDDVASKAGVDGILREKDEKIASLTTDLETANGTIETTNGKFQVFIDRDKAQLDEIIATLPENLRESVGNESIPLDVRLKLARDLSGKPHGPNPRPPGGTPPGNDLQTQYEEAVKRGDVSAQIALKNRILLDKEE